jgi:outer membrane protein assembly factor BamB
MSRPCAALLALLWLGTDLSRTRADDASPPAVLAGESRELADRLAEAGRRLGAKNWPGAVDALQAVIQAGGNELAPVSPRRGVQARRRAHLLLAAHADALKLYRGRVDPQARKWLERGVAARDVRLLRKVVDEAFCSRPAEQALDLLGDLAFERGHFDEADAWWRLLAPPEGRKKSADDLVYPDPRGDLARVRAKLLLASLFRGDPGWADGLKAFRARHGEAEGILAGRKGRYADLLQALADEEKGPAEGAGWPTFGGAPSRGRVQAAPPRLLEKLGALCRTGPTWRFRLDTREPLKPDDRPPPLGAATATQKARTMAFHPIVVGDKVLVADARYVTAYDLRRGSSEVWYDAAKFNAGVKPDRTLPARPDLRYTLTAADDCVLVRLGAQGVRDFRPGPGKAAKEANAESFLTCLNLRPGSGGERLRWEARALPRESSVFEGTALVHDGRAYVAASRFAGGRTVTCVRCYPLDARGPPLPRWSQDTCEGQELKPGEARSRHHLLTLAGPTLVYCSHAGAIVALDAFTGRRLWGVRYPRLSPRALADPKALRDLAPCVYADGRLYVAPADSDRLLCLDPADGRTLWERDKQEVVHLLGVGQGRLIYATPKGLRALDAADGRPAWSVPDTGELATLGRGLLIGDLVLWPTAQKGIGERVQDGRVIAVRQRDGRPAPDDPTLLRNVPVGNLVYAGGCLIVADRQVLSVFVPPARRLEERQQEADKGPKSAPAQERGREYLLRRGPEGR